jgi:hypothetical protein
MRKLIATMFNYSVDRLLADERTEFRDFCFGLPAEPDDRSLAARLAREGVRARHGSECPRGHPNAAPTVGAVFY